MIRPGKQVFANLVSSEDWVDVLMGLNLAHEEPDLLNEYDLTNDLENSFNENILKEVQMILKKNQDISKKPQRIKSKVECSKVDNYGA